MVKLKVQARVLPESEYDAVTISSRGQGRKFIVIVRNPEQWYIGTLAQEVSRTYQRMYKQPLGQIKYLKDREDCDLDPEQLVSDVLLDEGKAATDGHDQEAIFMVIQEQGHPVRHDSVIPDLTPAHYQARPRPPPPKFPELGSSLGKRSYGETTDTSEISDKRSKLVEIPETQEEVVPTIERSPELIRNTQHEQEDEDVFDDAEESHEQNNPVGRLYAGAQFPRTPSSGLLANGLSSSTASKFKTTGRPSVYAPPESDIEDSQMSPPKKDAVRTPFKPDMATIEAKFSQRSHNDEAVTDFNAQEALLPKSTEQLLPSSATAIDKSHEPVLTNGLKETSEEDSSEGKESDSYEPRPVSPANEQIQKTPQSPVKASIPPPSPTAKVPLPPAETKKRKREQAEANAKSTPAGKDKKKQKALENKMNDSLKVGLPVSPSRRTSGVVSELDSPGEQLSQSLWDTAKSGSLAESVKNVLGQQMAGGETKSKRKRKRDEKAHRRSHENSTSASSSRPTSSAGLSDTRNSGQKTTKKGREPQENASSQKSNTIAGKIAHAKSAAAAQAAGAGKSFKDKASKAVARIDDSKSTAKETTISAAKSELPLPILGTDSKDGRSLSMDVKPSFVLPQGMSEEDYLAMRARNEATPQPPKVKPAPKKKDPTPGRTMPESLPASKEKKASSQKKQDPSPSFSEKDPAAAKSVAETVKKAVQKAPEAAKNIVQQQSDSSSSSGEEESSSEGSESEEEDTKSKQSPSKASSKSISPSKTPAEVRQSKATHSVKDKAAMPPPTPNSTAKRREQKRQSEQPTPALSKKEASEKSKRSISSEPATAPAKAKTTSTPSKAAASAVASKTSAEAKPPVLEAKPSKLKAMREKLHSDVASKDSSPAPSASASKQKKPVQAQSSSSESESSSEDSSSDDDSASKKRAAKKKGKAAAIPRSLPDPSTRDATPDSSDSDDSE